MAVPAWPAMAQTYSPEVAMPEGLSCQCEMPLAWRAAQLDAHVRQAGMNEATYLLVALNQMEGVHEPEAGGPENRRLERIEAKLDLALHLLARGLNSGAQPASRLVQISPEGASWPDPAPPAEGSALIVELYPSEALPLGLLLPAIALPPDSGHARVRFADLPEALAEALYQFVFRRHRQAIRARSG